VRKLDSQKYWIKYDGVLFSKAAQDLYKVLFVSLFCREKQKVEFSSLIGGAKNFAGSAVLTG